VHAAQAFADYRQAHGTLRGCGFEARRKISTPNAKVIITTQPVDLRKLTLPEPPDIVLAMCIIWRLPTAAIKAERERIRGTPTERDVNAAGRRVTTKRNPLDVLRTPPDNDIDPEELKQQAIRRAELTAAFAKANGRTD
jgi:hypothetical protein